MGKMNSIAWKYFSILDKANKTAQCCFCNEVLSYRTTSGNLRAHLHRRHPQFHDNEGISTNEDLKNEASSDDERPLREESDIWSYFERETGGRARCAVCRAAVPHTANNLKHHLKIKHPKLFQELSPDSDNASDNEDENYTEIVYLEDASNEKREKRNTLPKEKPHKSVRSSLPAKRPRETSSEYVIKHPVDEFEDEITKFGTYVTCLLKTVPRDICTKLQMDIINLIMSAKLKQPETTDNKVLFEGVPVTLQNVGSGSGIIMLQKISSDEVKKNSTTVNENSSSQECDATVSSLNIATTVQDAVHYLSLPINKTNCTSPKS